MQEDGRLRDLRLLQLLVGTAEHDVRDAVAKDVVGLLEKFFRYWVVVVELLAHTDELCPLSGEYKCFHIYFFFMDNVFIEGAKVIIIIENQAFRTEKMLFAGSRRDSYDSYDSYFFVITLQKR